MKVSLAVLSLVTLIAADHPLRTIPIPEILPSPEEAAQQAVALSPEELVSLDIDEELRDRLRFDPVWQPIVQAVRQDVMILKWGDGQLTQPVWERYGPQSYPLLNYYSRTADPTRQIYGIVGIRRLGPPYSTLWLEQQLQRSQTAVNFYEVTQDTRVLLQPNWNEQTDSEAWLREFGLNDPATRRRLIEIARQRLEPDGSPEMYVRDGFQRNFLEALSELTYPPYVEEETPPLVIPAWDQLEAIAQPTEAQLQSAIAVYEQLSPEVQMDLLVRRLGKVPAGELSPVGRALLQSLAQQGDEFEQIWAIAELDRHGDPEGQRQLQGILNSNDLRVLYPLTRTVTYDRFWGEDLERATHAYYLLIGMVEKYPTSRFIEAARAYGDLRGRSYFGGESRSATHQARLEQQTPAERTAAWQDWLNRYPDHPGADDATYFLARSLQSEGRVLEAMNLWIALMEQPLGDQDALYLAWPHLRTLLDVGLTGEQLETLLQRHQESSLAPLLQYALAVHQARSQDYAGALATSENLDLTTLEALDTYYNLSNYWISSQDSRPQMQAMLEDQRQRWQQLQQWQATNTPETRYQIASNWADAGGWKNGYLAVWDEGRTHLLPTGDWGAHFCQVYWVCDTEQRGVEAVRAAYQQSSQIAIALQLYQDLIDDPQTPAALREKSLFMMASDLLWQWEDHPLGETFRIHPPPGIGGTEFASGVTLWNEDGEWDANYQQLEQDYRQAVDQIIAQLQQDFPQSRYIDELLFAQYFVSGEPDYLEQIVSQYSEGDRAAEAQFILAQRLKR